MRLLALPAEYAELGLLYTGHRGSGLLKGRSAAHAASVMLNPTEKAPLNTYLL